MHTLQSHNRFIIGPYREFGEWTSSRTAQYVIEVSWNGTSHDSTGFLGPNQNTE